MTSDPRASAGLSRRAFLSGTLAAGAVLASCGRPPSQSPPPRSTEGGYDLRAAINRTEAGRPHSGRTVTATLTPQKAAIDLGGVNVQTLAYGDAIPAPPIRANVGDEIAVTVTNRLDRPTSVHWHGIALRNDMDGAEPATPNINSGQSFTDRFSAPHPVAAAEGKKRNLGVALLADNPGIWMMHCHNTYHQAAGMMTSLDYTT